MRSKYSENWELSNDVSIVLGGVDTGNDRGKQEPNPNAC